MIAFSRLSVFSLALMLFACTDPVDRAAKKRIFSEEDPPQAIAQASEKLPPQDVADKSNIARRILEMGAAEATERIGAHTYQAKIVNEWDNGVSSNKLEEKRKLSAAAGGVSGDFHAVFENSRDLGLEILRVNGQVFAKNRYGKFRERKRDRGIAERMREEAYSAIPQFDRLFRGRVKLESKGTQLYEDRLAWKYLVSLGPAHEEEKSRLPSMLVPKNGVDETTRRRMEFEKSRQPERLEGEVLVDQQTSVVLKARLDGRLVVKSKEGTATLRMTLDASMTRIGKDPELQTPVDFLPDQDKPLGIAAALERFGLRKGTFDGGTPTLEMPEDSDEEK